MPHDDDEPWREPEPTLERPTGLGACAFAATARELRFRVQAPNSLPRASVVVALDHGAARMLEGIREAPWGAARFLRLALHQPGMGEVMLADPSGAVVRASEAVAGRDLLVMVAASADGARAAEALGRLARAGGVMAAGVVVAGERAEEVVRALRPHAAVLVTAGDEDYLPAMLSALRA
jgi:hypothetical protein